MSNDLHNCIKTMPYLHAKSKDGDDYLKDQCECQLPEGAVDPWPGWSVWYIILWTAHIGVIDVIAELGGLESTTVIK